MDHFDMERARRMFIPHSVKPKPYYRKVQAENLGMRNIFIYT
jgi:hypothetical protein